MNYYFQVMDHAMDSYEQYRWSSSVKKVDFTIIPSRTQQKVKYCWFYA